MLSGIARLKTLSLLNKTLLKSEIIPVLCTKTGFSTFRLLSCNKFDAIRNVNVHDLVSANDPEDFGKVVDLDPNEVVHDFEERVRRGKGKKKKNITQEAVEDIVEANSSEDEVLVQPKEKTEKKIREKKILNLKKACLGSVMANLKSKRQRQKYGKIFLEGKRLINDAINAGHHPLVLFYSRKSDLENFNLSPDVQCTWVPYKTLQLWSDVNTSQGLIGVFNMPNLEDEINSETALPLIVICDNIREPGNMGCIIRLLSAVGCRKLFMTNGCVDIWESKVLRAASGAHFRSSIIQSMKWDEIENNVPQTSKVFLADCDCSTRDSGIEEEKRGSFKTQTSKAQNLPLKPYDSVNYVSENTVLVIGGETEGLSSSAYQFAEARQGVKVFIPMSNGIESLNTSVALGILSYEVRRQMQQTESQVEDSSDEPNFEGFSPEPIIPINA